MRIRTIKPEFWIHEGLCALPDFTRLLAIALLNWADDEGYFMANPAILRGSLFPFLEDSQKIPRSLQELSVVGWIELGKDAEGREIGRVTNFTKHQRVDKPKPSEIKASSTFQDASKNGLGRIQGGMEGNGREEEGNGKGAGNPSQDKPGGTLLSAGSSIPDALPAPTLPDVAASAIPPEPKKRKGGGPPPDPAFPDDVSVEYQHSLALWWHYKRERHESYKPAGWAALIRQQLKFPAEQVLASVEASMSNNWAGLFTHKCADSVLPGSQKKEGARPSQGIAEPPWNWRGIAAELGMIIAPGEPWGVLERKWQIAILRAQKEKGQNHE